MIYPSFMIGNDSFGYSHYLFMALFKEAWAFDLKFIFPFLC